MSQIVNPPLSTDSKRAGISVSIICGVDGAGEGIQALGLGIVAYSTLIKSGLRAGPMRLGVRSMPLLKMVLTLLGCRAIVR